jgi:hypothetical protein
MKRRTIQQLVQAWDNLANDTEMVDFIDSLNPTETKLLDMAIRGGLATKEPAYMNQVPA